MNFEELKNKYGMEKLNGVTDIMLECMCEDGIKYAKIVLNCKKTIDILLEIMMLSSDIEKEEILEDIISFTDDLKDMIDKYYNRLKGGIK